MNDPQIKQDMKEAFEFGGEKLRPEIKNVLTIPQIKQDIKEALE